MAHRLARSNIETNRRQPPVTKNQGKRPQTIKKKQVLRKSLRLQAIRQSHKKFLSNSKHIHEVQAPLSPPASNNHDGRKASKYPYVLYKLPESAPKRKRGQDAAHRSTPTHDQPPLKRLRALPSGYTAKLDSKKEAATETREKVVDPLKYWARNQTWPKVYFEQDSQIREDLEQDSWLEEQMEDSIFKVQYVEVDGLRLPCPIRKVQTSVRRKQSDSSLNSSSDQKNRETKSAPYRTTRYTTLLEGKGSYMHDYDEDNIPQDMEDLCNILMKKEQSVPQDSLFRKDIFKKTCRKIEDRNEARVIQDIARLIVPSAETLATYGATHLDHLIEGVNESWTGSIAVEGPLSRPDYSVGFRRSAFTHEQLKKLDPLIGSVFDNSLFVATYRMYFPFFTCEVKCGAAALDIADRQNAHSMTVAVRALTVLFRSVKREKELNREILTFSVSHDHRSVRIYGHYPVIERDNTTFYRHPIHTFDFTALDGKEKWTTYKFVKNVYDHHSLKLHKLICSAIDDLPTGINFALSQSASSSQSTTQNSQQSNAESILDENNSQSSFLASQEVTPTTSFTRATEPAFKKPKNQRADRQRR